MLGEVYFVLRKSFTIRKASEDDVGVISESIEEWLSWKIPREDSIKRAVKKRELLVAELEGHVSGFIHYVPHEDIIDGGTNFFITCLYVTPERRNQGTGSALLNAALEDAFNRGARGVETSTSNPDARRLYERYGFKQFMGNWTMGEVFLEMNVKKYREKYGENSQTRTSTHVPCRTRGNE